MITVNIREFRKSMARYLSMKKRIRLVRFGKTIATLKPFPGYFENKQAEMEAKNAK